MIPAIVEEIPQRTTGWELGKQLTRSGTGIGANVHEADRAQSSREFARFVNIARREAAETMYWLRLCLDHKLLAGAAAEDALCEAGELVGILTSIVAKCEAFLDRVD